MDTAALEKYFNIVFDQEYSPSGKHLATCDVYGQITVFSIAAALSVSSVIDPKTKNKALSFTGHRGPAYSLQTVDSLLVSGGSEDIRVWNWDQLTCSEDVEEPVTILQPPVVRKGNPDSNGLAYDKQNTTLYSACGDGCVHAWDLTTGKLKASYSGHTSYVHCVCCKNSESSQFISGGEDGCVCIWDPSTANHPVHTLRPMKGKGEWIGCVAVDESGEWMVCGGSSAPCMYHLGSFSKTTTFPVPQGMVTQGAIFAGENVVTVGSNQSIHHWTVNGSLVAAVPSDQTHAFSVAVNNRSPQYKVLTVTGDSANVSVSVNFGYKAFSLTVPGPSQRHSNN